MRSSRLALALATSALASDVLVPGNPPLTTGIVQNVTSVLRMAGRRQPRFPAARRRAANAAGVLAPGQQRAGRAVG